MARDMREQFIKASRLHFKAHIEKHRINVENLMENAVGVGEHGDIMDTIEKEMEEISKYHDLLEVIDTYFNGKPKKELKATRVPPGDRWAIVDDDKEKVYSSLTEVLNAIFMQTGISEFYMDAKQGEVHIEDGKVKPEPIKKFSLYGEEI